LGAVHWPRIVSQNRGRKQIDVVVTPEKASHDTRLNKARIVSHRYRTACASKRVLREETHSLPRAVPHQSHCRLVNLRPLRRIHYSDNNPLFRKGTTGRLPSAGLP
jgi:hypothetical protein